MTNFKILLLGLFAIGSLTMSAQDASYTYKPLASEGCNINFTALRQNGKAYLTISVRSDEGLCFVDSPMVMIRTADKEVIKITGKNIGVREENSSSVVIANRIMHFGGRAGMAMFEMSEEQIKHLETGVVKIRLSTLPFVHEREFRKDKIGKKLFKAFQERRDTEF